MPEYTPNSVVQKLLRLSEALDAAVTEYHAVQQRAAEAKRDAEKAEATAFLGAEGSVQARQAQARLAASDERYKADLAERMVLVTRESMRSLQVRIDVGRTLSATVRKEMEL